MDKFVTQLENNNFINSANLKKISLPNKKIIYQSPSEQAISSDGNFLVETVLENHPQDCLKVLDIGCGCGVLSFMLKLSRPNWQIIGIDIQENLVQLANYNSKICGLEVDFFHEDLRTYIEKFDLVICNPPFYPQNSGKMPKDKGKQIARFEIECNQEDVFSTIKRCLKTNGAGYVLYPLSRLENQNIVKIRNQVGIVEITQ